MDVDREIYSLAYPQKRVWYTEKIYPNTAVNNIGGMIKVMDTIDFSILEKAIQHVIQVNDSLRLQFFQKGERLFQEIVPYSERQILKLQFERESIFQRWIEEKAQELFALTDHPLYEFILFDIRGGYKGCFIRMHHLVADGWSMEIITRQLKEQYELCLADSATASVTMHSYYEYLTMEEHYMHSVQFKKDRDFWLEQFAALPENAVFHLEPDVSGRRDTYKMTSALSEQIRSFVKEQGITLNTYFVLLYLLYLYKTSGISDLTIGMPVMNRMTAAQKETVGMFTSTVPFRFNINPADTVTSILHRVQSALFQYLRHQRYPYDLLIQELKESNCKLSGLFTDCVNFFSTGLIKEIAGISTVNEQFYPGCQIYSLNINIKEWTNNGMFTIDFDYHSRKHTTNSISQMFSFFCAMSMQMLANPSAKIKKLDGLTEEYRIEVLNKFNATLQAFPSGQLMHRLIEMQAAKTPERIAVCHGTQNLTYRQLNRRSNGLAKVLIHAGVKHLDLVGIMATHSIQTVVAILAVLKAGAAYVPIDPEYPSGRINDMMEDAGIGTLLADSRTMQPEVTECQTIDLNQLEETDEIPHPSTSMHASDPAYVIYTSGSTGKSKGVVISHRSLINYIWWAAKQYHVIRDDVFPLYSSFSFDLTVTSIFTPLIAGAKIIIYDSDDEYALYKVFKDNRATIIKLTPSHLALIKDMDCRESSITRMIVGGEDLHTSLAKQIYEAFGEAVAIYNEYGPTEATVGCMTYRYDPSIDKGNSVPIGVPADNTLIYILNHDKNPVVPGQIGEIYIGGAGVAQGYLNRPELTAQRFLDTCSPKKNRLFRTGDLAKFNIDGQVEFCGRNDTQVKINGYRIELHEIEKTFELDVMVQQALVVTDSDSEGKRFLNAYLVADKNLNLNSVRMELADKLPAYMIPRHFFKIEQIPLTQNGKVDLEKLSHSSIPNISKGNDNCPMHHSAFTALSNAIEEVLQKSHVELNDNFYYIGGDSIQAIQISAKLSMQGFHLSVQDILLFPTINEMLTRMTGTQDDPLKSHRTDAADFSPTPIQHWFLSQRFPQAGHYNQSVLLRFDKRLKRDSLQKILSSVVQRHLVFRISQHKGQEAFYYQNADESDFKLADYDLSHIASEELKNNIENTIAQMDLNFSLENDLLIKGACFFTREGYYVFLSAHHLCVDVVSWLVLIEEIRVMTKQAIDARTVSLPELHGISYAQWSRMLYDGSQTLFEEEVFFWNQMLAENVVYQPYFQKSEKTQSGVAHFTYLLDWKEIASLNGSQLKVDKTHMETMLLSALSLALCEFTGQDKVSLMMESHGRLTHPALGDITQTVGWFTSLYPFTLKIVEKETIKLMEQVHRRLQTIPNLGVGYGVLKYIHHRLNAEEPHRPVLFNFFGDFRAVEKKDFVSLMQWGFVQDVSIKNLPPNLLEINTMLLDEGISFDIRYNSAIVSLDSLERFMAIFRLSAIDVLSIGCNWREPWKPSADFIGLSEQEIDILFE